MVLITAVNADELKIQHETKIICHDKKDNKGSIKRTCKKVKIHRKFVGIKVPDKKDKN
jgi:hypothetical protein